MDQQHLDGLYLCDPNKNSTRNGTVCFYRDDCLYHLRAITSDPACAMEGPDGEPIRVDMSFAPRIWDGRENGGCYYAET